MLHSLSSLWNTFMPASILTSCGRGAVGGGEISSSSMPYRELKQECSVVSEKEI